MRREAKRTEEDSGESQAGPGKGQRGDRKDKTEEEERGADKERGNKRVQYFSCQNRAVSKKSKKSF